MTAATNQMSNGAHAKWQELGCGMPPNMCHDDVDMAFVGECTAPPSASQPIIEVARAEARLPMLDADVFKTLGSKNFNVWGQADGIPLPGFAAQMNTLGTPGVLPGPTVIFGWRIRVLVEQETRRIPGNQYTPPLGNSFLPGSPDVWTANDLANALGVPAEAPYLPSEFLQGLPTWRVAYAFMQARQANWFAAHQEQIWKEPLTQCATIQPFSEAEAAGLAFTTNQDVILDLNRRLVTLGVPSQFLPEKFVRNGSVTAAGLNVGLFAPSRAADASSTIFGGTGVPQDSMMKKPYLFNTPIFWPQGRPCNFVFEQNSQTVYQAECERWASVTGGTGGNPGLDQNLPFSDLLNGLMPSVAAGNTMNEQTDDPMPIQTPQQVQTNVALEKGGKMIFEIGLIAKRVPPAWYTPVARAIAMKAIECPVGPGDLAARLDQVTQELKAQGKI